MKVGIANDLAMAAEALRRVVVDQGGHEVLWIARTGLEAVALCAAQVPDVVLMDLNMPALDGVEATRRIMQASPCAVLVVTGRPQDETAQVFRALGAGALDVTATPLLRGDPNGADALLAKLRTIAKLVHAPASPRLPAAARAPALTADGQPVRRLLAIGASTGGPSALADILAGWQAAPDAAIVVVQHIDAAFATQLCRWLSDQLTMPVRVAAEGAALQPGAIHIARTNDHLVLGADGALRYTAAPRECAYRPSVDVFFHSVARHWRGAAVGVLLTGMGRDGAAGLLALRQAGHLTLAQDAASCAVYGMPRAAAELGAAEKILPLELIAMELRSRIAASP
ncbi:MAG: chemotaxis-specific protein-glutamate methyltransferase CheB [Telluria sp.]